MNLVGNLDRGRISTSNSTAQVPSAGLGVQLSVPLYTGGIVASRVREAQAQVDLAQAQLDDILRVLETELRKAYLELGRASEQMRVQTGVLATVNESLDATRKAFEAGARTNIDLLNSQQLSFATRRELMRARFSVVTAQARIFALTGTLDREALAKFDAWFDGETLAEMARR